MLCGISVELPAMLAAREERAARQRAWQNRYSSPLLSFTLNIPGPIKTTPALHCAFVAGLSALEKRLSDARLPCIAQAEFHAPTGDEALLAIRGDAKMIKAIAVAIEEQHPLGRLFDMDVLDTDGTKLSRTIPRRCLLCMEPAAACARSRRHNIAELTAKIERLLDAYR